MPMDPKAVTDSAVIAAAVTSPAWAHWLADINAVLTMLTLLVGLALGIGRFVAFLRDRKRKNPS